MDMPFIHLYEEVVYEGPIASVMTPLSAEDIVTEDFTLIL